MQWLSGAVKDATALHALFTDALGDSADLLVDDTATAPRIRSSLKSLPGTAGPDDVVVVVYAGHGSEDHHLVGHDADVSDMAATCISLDELADSISAIPGKTLLCALDCCFSGGLGARVFSTGAVTRGVATDQVSVSLDRFTGQGRVALTASASNQPALESVRNGHGLLTFRLLEALQGAPEVCEGKQINLYKLIEYVTRTVEADALQMGHEQTPTLRGKLDGAPLWPVLKPGPRYASLFPDRVRPPVTAELESLAPYGFSSQVIDAWGGAIPSLNELQITAVNDYGLLDGQNLVVTAPTSSGKTMIGELAALKSAITRQRTVFLLPMKALVNDKYNQFTNLYDEAGLTTIRATGDHSDDVPALLRGQFDIALLTYEKYSMLALGNPHILDLAGTVVVDETQILADTSRGPNLEFLLTLLNNRRGLVGAPQIITLSAVVGDLGGLERWLGARNLHSEQRPVPLVEGVLDEGGSYHRLDEHGAEDTEAHFIQPLYDRGSRRLLIPLVERLVSEDKKVLVFRQSKGEAVACAVYLSQVLGLAPAQQAIERITEGDISSSTRTLRTTLGAGVAFHNTDLDKDERRIIEEEFRDPDSSLRVVSATPTLAMGVNTPASAVAIVGLTHPGRTPTPYSVAEYKNMVGRAGRLGFTERGESYLIPEGQLDASRGWASYVCGELENLTSHLVRDGDPRSLMLRVIASYPPDATGLVTENDVVGFLESSFAAFQAREGGSAQWSHESLSKSFEQLAAAGLIESDGGGYRLTELGRFTGESGVHVDSIVRLVHVLRHERGPLNSIALIAAAQLTKELDDVYLPVNARGRNTEVPRWPAVLQQQQVPNSIIQALASTATDGAQGVRRSKRAAAAAMWINGVALESIEQQLNQHLYNRGGLAGTIRGIADRTRDLLPAVAAVVRDLDPSHLMDSLVDRTATRLEFGIPADIVDVVLRLRIDLTRADWLRMRGAGLQDLDALRAAGLERLTEVLGSAGSAELIAAALADVRDEGSGTEELVMPAPTE